MMFRHAPEAEVPPDFGGSSGTTLDLGCGTNPRNPSRASRVIGVDVGDRPQTLPAEVEYVRCLSGFEALPLHSESVDVCTGYDFIEHVPRTEYEDGVLRFPFIELMNETWRVLRPGGFFIALTPAFPASSAFVDPTHVNIITRGTIRYFEGAGGRSPARSYGFLGGFEIVANTWIPPSSSLWTCPSVGNPQSVDWRTELRRMRRMRLWYEGWALIGRPRTHHLLWILKKNS
jgi:SAM-dependent methyltransferase